MRRSAYESDRTLIVSAVSRARITVDYETVHNQDYTQAIPDIASVIRRAPVRQPCPRKAFCRSRKRATDRSRPGGLMHLPC
jgi:hypothetical protein